MAAGRYAPGTAAGQHLLAHELAHVVQAPGKPTGLETLEVGPADDPAEHEAERAADAVVEGTPVGVASADGARAIRRFDEGEAESVADTQPDLVGTKLSKTPTEAELRGLAARPSQALARWKSLDKDSQTSLWWFVVERYGMDFAADFLDYAKGKKKPDPTTTVSNSADDSPEALAKRGFKYCCDPGGMRVYVHPSGREVWLLSPPQKAEDPEDFQKRCTEHCLVDTEDEDDCNDCCDNDPAMAKADEKCRKACHTACSFKL
jgi:hypothetical protein